MLPGTVCRHFSSDSIDTPSIGWKREANASFGAFQARDLQKLFYKWKESPAHKSKALPATRKSQSMCSLIMKSQHSTSSNDIQKMALRINLMNNNVIGIVIITLFENNTIPRYLPLKWTRRREKKKTQKKKSEQR